MIEKLGKLIIAGFRGLKISNDTQIRDWINNFHISGVILYDVDLEYYSLGSRNIQSKGQLKRLTSSLQSLNDEKLFICIDQEGGRVNRLKSDYGFPKFESWNKIGLKDDQAYTKSYAKKVGQELSDLGINFNLAPVLDFDYGKESFISLQERSISLDPELIVKHSKTFINELEKLKILSCGKHFPGQGSASGDTHEGLVDITKTWDKKELIPYSNLIKENILNSIIVAHTFHKNLDPKYPSSMSGDTINKLLRKELGFDGLVISDDPSMKAISDHYNLKTTIQKMLNAGVDLLIFGNNLNYDPDLIPKAINCLCELFEEGLITESRINQSIERINRIKSKL